ncbi:MAG: DNA polymerase domain-containing protein [Methanobacteriota archaeon]
MPSWDVRLLSVSYTRAGDVTVQLFGRTRDGRSITALHQGFKPYFYISEPDNGVIQRLKQDQDVLKVESAKLFVDGAYRHCAKVTVKYPWTVPDYRRRYPSSFFLAADIPFSLRFMYDMGIESCVRITGEPTERGNYTTELVVQAEKFEPCEAFKPRLKILSFDIENSIKEKHLLVLGAAIMDTDGSVRTEHIPGPEPEIIKGFVELVRREDPDVITGYNIDGYDIPYVMERAKANGISSVPLGRDGGVANSVSDRFWRVHGRIVADAWWNAKRELRPKQETLDAVARLVLGEGKADVDPSNIDEEWRQDSANVTKYCVRDAELALRILDKISVLQKMMDLATVSMLPLDDVLNGRTSVLIDSILIREADKLGIGVMMNRHERRETQIEGGYVHTIEPGIYPWVCVLDFKSMYPSLIISKNICFTTLSKDGANVSPTGEKFLAREVREGVVPKVLGGLMARRDEIKKSMKQAKTPEEKAYYDGLQQAVKVLMNAFYGVFASAFYRFTNPKIGASITAFARENTKGIISSLEAEGHKVIYGDTDSVFVQSPTPELEASVEFGKSISAKHTKEGATLEFEKLLNPLFSHGAKKRYVGKVVWPDETIVVRGYEIRRTDAFDMQSETLEAVFGKILDNDPDGAVETAVNAVRDCLDGKVSIEALVVSRTCREESSYKDPDTQMTVQAARKLTAMGYEFVPGMKVSWIVVDGRKSPAEVEPYVSGRVFDRKPDWEYYARRTAMTLARATEYFGWNVSDLLAGKKGAKQSDLFNADFEGPQSNGGNSDKPKAKPGKKDVVKKTDKALKIEDFL